MKKYQKLGLSILSLCTAFPFSANAQAPDTATLKTVIVSATKTPASRASLTQAVTVLSGGDLRARGITRVVDALRAVPGAAVVQSGSYGSVTSLFLRGGESRYTKVMIDGVAVNSPGGYFDFSHLTTDNIERIEVVRGPASVVYGADAVSGIVRIFTRQGRGKLTVSADGRAGTLKTREGGVEISGANPRARYSIGGGAHRTDGILPFNNEYYNGTLSGSAGFTPADGTDALVTARYTTAEFHYPTDFTGAVVDSNSYRVQHRLTVGVDATTKLAESIKGRLLVGTNEVSDLSEDIAIPFGASVREHSSSMSRNKRRTAEAGLVFLLPSTTTLNIGGEYLDERERSVNSAGPVGGAATPTSRFNADRRNKAVYSELIGSAEGATYTLAARRDDNSDYDAFTTYRVGTSVPIGVSTRFRGSLSTSFNAPAFNQIRPSLFTVGSPDLKPERARSWEAGIEQALIDGILRASAGYFNQRFSDLIQYVSGGPPTYLGSYANLAGAESNGYEGEITLTPVNAWSATAAYTYAKPRVTKISSGYSGDLTEGQALLRRPQHSGNAAVTWSKVGTGSLSAIASYVGERPDLDFNQFPSPTVTLPAYIKLDFAVSKDIIRDEKGKGAISLTFRVENALDKKYEDVLHFPAPRRTFLFGARYTGSI
ncbi:MAG: TonB-dependent receptor [Gemmatimonadales bacterium]